MMDDVVLKKATIGDLEAVQILNQKLFKREFEKYNKLLNIEWTFAEKGTNYFQQLIENDFVYVPFGKNNTLLKAKVLRIDKNVSTRTTPIPFKRLKKISSIAL